MIVVISLEITKIIGQEMLISWEFVMKLKKLWGIDKEEINMMTETKKVKFKDVLISLKKEFYN